MFEKTRTALKQVGNSVVEDLTVLAFGESIVVQKAMTPVKEHTVIPEVKAPKLRINKDGSVDLRDITFKRENEVSYREIVGILAKNPPNNVTVWWIRIAGDMGDRRAIRIHKMLLERGVITGQDPVTKKYKSLVTPDNLSQFIDASQDMEHVINHKIHANRNAKTQEHKRGYKRQEKFFRKGKTGRTNANKKSEVITTFGIKAITDKNLEKLARVTGKTKTSIINNALDLYIDNELSKMV